MAKKEDKKTLPENVNQVKELELFFPEDKYYKGELAYKKGVHKVETKDGWAGRWIARGAKLVVGKDHVEVQVGEKGEIVTQGKPVTTPEPAPEESAIIKTSPENNESDKGSEGQDSASLNPVDL